MARMRFGKSSDPRPSIGSFVVFIRSGQTAGYSMEYHETLTGQVWERGLRPGTVWVVLSDGTARLVRSDDCTRTGGCGVRDGES
jgi:hypothetical protein